MVEFEELLELDLMHLMEAAPAVAAYRQQPIDVRYPDGEVLRTYTPDLEVLFAYFSPSWTAFQVERGRDFSVIVDGVSA